MRAFYIYNNPILGEIYLQERCDWKNRVSFRDITGLVDYLNSDEPLSKTLRERGKIAIHLSGDLVGDLEEALKKVSFKKQPKIERGEPPKQEISDSSSD